MEKIPDEVRKQIEAESKDYMRSTLKGFVGDFDFSTSYLEYAHTTGAEFGYSLASKALSDANKEIERLKGFLYVQWLINNNYHTNKGYVNELWEKFKTDRNI